VYERLAEVYDELMGDVPYESFVQIWQEMLAATQLPTQRLIDMGCGTGALFSSWLGQAKQVIGVDPSAEMLAQAAVKAQGYGPRVTLLQARAAEFRSPARADGCVAFCDVLNYTGSEQELTDSLQAIAQSLTPRGWVLFDLHSPHKILHVIGEGVYCDTSESAVAIMKTKVDVELLRVSYEVVLMLEEVDGFYSRHEEEHTQRAYTLEVVLRALASAGFQRVCAGTDFLMDWKGFLTTSSKEEAGASDLCAQFGLSVCHIPTKQQMDQAERWIFFASLT